MDPRTHLFALNSMEAIKSTCERAIRTDVEAMPESRLMQESLETLIGEMVDKHAVKSCGIDEEHITVRQKQNESFRQGERSLLPWVDYLVPICGNADLLMVTPTTYTLNRPSGTIRDGFIVVSFKLDQGADSISQAFAAVLENIKGYLEHVNADIARLNDTLPSVAISCLETRRGKIANARQTIANLGYPVKE